MTHDPEVDAAYIYLVPIGPGDSVRQEVPDADGRGGSIILDFDREDHLIGIEVLGASSVLPAAVLAHAVPPGHE